MINIYKILITIFLLLSLTPDSEAQKTRIDKSNRSLKNNKTEIHFSDSIRRVVVNSLIHPAWIMGCNKILLTTNSSDGLKTFSIACADEGKIIRLFDGNEYANIVTQLTGKSINPLNPNFNIQHAGNRANELICTIEGESFLINLVTMKFSYPDSTDQKQHSPRFPYRTPIWKRYTWDGEYAIYCKEHNMYLYKADHTGADSLTQLTFDGGSNRSFAMKSRGVNIQNQPQGWPGQWFNDSHIGYILIEDKRRVSTLTLVNSLTQSVPKAMEYKFELPGDQYITNYELWLIDAKSAKAVKADIENFEGQEVKLVYSTDMDDPLNNIFFTRRNRVGDTLELCRIDPFTGKTELLITESHKPIINELLHTCMPINGGKEIIWWSERTGKGAYYLYDDKGNLINPITNGNFVAGNIALFDREKRYMIIEGYGFSEQGNPYYKNFFKVNLDGSGFTHLTPEDGEHYISVSQDRKYLIDCFSTVEKMPRCEIRDINGNLRVTIPMQDESILTKNGWNFPKIEKVMAADEKTDLWGIIYTPPGFDSFKKYPVICNVYPGPQMDGIPQTFTLEKNNNTSLAEMGFIVLQFGYRGSSPLRGSDFYNYGHWNLRDYPLADCKYVVEQLAAKYPYFDLDRVGIYGHSGGGFMSATAIMTYPDFFKVAVASSGNHDNNIYGKFWSETYHGVESYVTIDSVGRKEVKFRSQAPTNIELAPNLKGKLLLITGDLDSNVHPANTMRLVHALIQHNKKFDMMVIPGAGHEMGGSYYNNLILDYFNEHLKNPKEFNAEF